MRDFLCKRGRFLDADCIERVLKHRGRNVWNYRKNEGIFIVEFRGEGNDDCSVVMEDPKLLTTSIFVRITGPHFAIKMATIGGSF